MKHQTLVGLCLAGAVGLLAGAASLYTVGQTQQAVVLRFGAPEKVVNAGGASGGPGLYAKWPLVERVVAFDRRVLNLQADPVEMTTADGAPRAVNATLSYRIIDPLQAYLSSGAPPQDVGRLQQLLDASVTSTLRSARQRDGADDGKARLTQAALIAVRRAAVDARLGVQITDLRLVDALPPPSAIQALSHRMQEAERGQASQVRVQGEARKRDLMAQADREALDIRGDGDRQALEVRGDGDAQRVAILGSAYGADPDFARFFRRLEAYDQALNPENTTLVLSPDNAFLDLFGHGPTGEPRPQ